MISFIYSIDWVSPRNSKSSTWYITLPLTLFPLILHDPVPPLKTYNSSLSLGKGNTSVSRTDAPHRIRSPKSTDLLCGNRLLVHLAIGFHLFATCLSLTSAIYGGVGSAHFWGGGRLALGLGLLLGLVLGGITISIYSSGLVAADDILPLQVSKILLLGLNIINNSHPASTWKHGR